MRKIIKLTYMNRQGKKIFVIRLHEKQTSFASIWSEIFSSFNEDEAQREFDKYDINNYIKQTEL